MPTTGVPGGTDAHGGEFSVLVGWKHAPCNRGIQLRLQGAAAAKPDEPAIAAHTYLMTRNQALILARYLLDATGQSLPPPQPRRGLRRLLHRFWSA